MFISESDLRHVVREMLREAGQPPSSSAQGASSTAPVTRSELLHRAFFMGKSGVKIKSSAIPDSIISIPENLQLFLNSKGRSDVIIGSNGAGRSLPGAVAGGGDRLPGSLHGIGYAHDLKINSPKSGTYNHLSVNVKILEKDPELVPLLHEFAVNEDLEWGGLWEKGNSFLVESEKFGDQVYWSGELHHFELKEYKFESEIDPDIKEYMKMINLPTYELYTAQGRTKLYKSVLRDF